MAFSGFKFAVGDCCGCPSPSPSPSPPPPSPSPSIVSIDCAECDQGAMADCWELAIAGITGSCTECSNANGTFILNQRPCLDISGACCVQSEGFDFIASGTCTPVFQASWKLLFFVGKWSVVLDGNDGVSFVAIYSVESGFDCLGPNTLPLDTLVGHCSGFPLTVTVTPIACP